MLWDWQDGTRARQSVVWAGVPPLRDLKYINRVNSSPCKQHWRLCGVLQVFNLIPQKEHFGTRSGCGLYVSVHPVAIPPGAADLSLRGAMFYFRGTGFPGRRRSALSKVFGKQIVGAEWVGVERHQSHCVSACGSGCVEISGCGLEYLMQKKKALERVCPFACS